MKLLLAIDHSASSEGARCAVVNQFHAGSTEVCVLHAMQWQRSIPISFSFARGNTYGPQFSALMTQARRRAETLVTGTADTLRGSGFCASAAVVEGDPFRAILDRAVEWGAELIVLGVHDRTGLDRILFRNMSEKVARHAPCSVEIVRAHRV